MAGGLIAAEFFRVTIALVVALAVAIVVGGLAYYVRMLKRKVDALEDMLESVGSTEYLRWALDQTDEFGPAQDNDAPQRRHLWLVPAVVGGWLADRLSRQPLATAVAAATTAVVASLATAPSMDGGGKPWSPPPAAAEEPPPSVPLELRRGSAGAVSTEGSPTATTTSTTTLGRENETSPSTELAPSSPTSTTTTSSTLLPPLTVPSVPVPTTDKPGLGPPVTLPPVVEELLGSSP